MKYCGVVTDYKVYKMELNPQSKMKTASWYEGFTSKEWTTTCLNTKKPQSDKRIYSDEVPMADEEMLSFIRWGRRLVFMNSQKAEKFIYWGSRIG